MVVESVRVAQDAYTAQALDDVSLRSMTPRVTRLLTLAQQRMGRKQAAWGAGLSVLDDPAMAAQPLVLRKARAFERTLLEMPITIEEDDLIVGLTAQDGVIVRAQLPRYATEGEMDAARQAGKYIGHFLAHKTPYYALLMDQGLAGVIADIARQIEQVAACSPSTERAEKLALLEAMRYECTATIALAGRFADLAEELASRAPTSARRGELLEIARVCRHVPANPPRTFQEALQSFWFVHYALFTTHTQLSCGRIDQYLYPALQRDLDAGVTTLAQAQELLDCLWIRFNDRAQIVRANFAPRDEGGSHPWEAGHRTRTILDRDAADAVNHWGQNILLSGIRPDGADGTNGLTYLCLNAHEKFAFTSPVVTARLHRASPPALVERVAEVLKDDGSGMPYINNDDVLIPAYADLGVPIEDARDYANSNCWETLIQGKSDQELIRGINFLLLLELALNRGYSHVHGPMGPDTGDPRAFGTFQDLLEAWKTQMDHLVKAGVDYVGEHVSAGTLEHSGHGLYSHYPLLSSLTLDCIAKAADVTRCGARYTLWHVMAEGVANTIDALAAIRKLVYEEHALSMDALLAALAANWEGLEPLRQRVASLPDKFANDHDATDAIGREIMDYFVERSRLHARRWYPTVIYPCAVGTFSWIQSVGYEVAATPDGRHASEPVAANLSPVPGVDRSGPVAAIYSALKMRVGDLAAGAPMDLRLAKSALAGDAGTQRLAALIKGFIDLGGNMLVLSVTDVEELKRAMVEPDNYRGLRIRMGGWSAYFVMLSREAQLVHIRRVEHGLG